MYIYIIFGIVGILVFIGTFYTLKTIYDYRQMTINYEDLKVNRSPDTCPECSHKMTIKYVNPIFKTQNYWECIKCGHTEDAIEDTTIDPNHPAWQ